MGVSEPEYHSSTHICDTFHPSSCSSHNFAYFHMYEALRIHDLCVILDAKLWTVMPWGSFKWSSELWPHDFNVSSESWNPIQETKTECSALPSADVGVPHTVLLHCVMLWNFRQTFHEFDQMMTGTVILKILEIGDEFVKHWDTVKILQYLWYNQHHDLNLFLDHCVSAKCIFKHSAYATEACVCKL